MYWKMNIIRLFQLIFPIEIVIILIDFHLSVAYERSFVISKHFFPSVFLKNLHFFSGKDYPSEDTHPESTDARKYPEYSSVLMPFAYWSVVLMRKSEYLSTTIEYLLYDIEFLMCTHTELFSSLMVFVILYSIQYTYTISILFKYIPNKQRYIKKLSNFEKNYKLHHFGVSIRSILFYIDNWDFFSLENKI